MNADKTIRFQLRLSQLLDRIYVAAGTLSVGFSQALPPAACASNEVTN
jgi:hypothetical protein